MLTHDFTDMPGKADGDTVMLLRCRFCKQTPAKAREDGCPPRVLEEVGQILLREWNPKGVGYFAERTCITCERPIMGHWLKRGTGEAYWCDYACSQESGGINGCVYDVADVKGYSEGLL